MAGDKPLFEEKGKKSRNRLSDNAACNIKIKPHNQSNKRARVSGSQIAPTSNFIGRRTRLNLKYRVSDTPDREFPYLKKHYWGRHIWSRGYFTTTNEAFIEDIALHYLEQHVSNPADDSW